MTLRRYKFRVVTKEHRRSIYEAGQRGVSMASLIALDEAAFRYRQMTSPENRARRQKPHVVLLRAKQRLKSKRDLCQIFERGISDGERSVLSDAREITELRGGDPDNKLDVLQTLERTRPAKEPQNPALKGLLMAVVRAWYDATGEWPVHKWDVGIDAHPFVLKCLSPIRRSVVSRHSIESAVEACKLVDRTGRAWEKAGRP